MHATIQSGACSPTLNGPTLSNIKTNSDNVQTSTSVPSQAKGGKRDREDQGSEPIKKCSPKAYDFDSARYKSEKNILKFEVSKITEKGGLVNSEGVEKLIQLMKPNRVEKKLELFSRSFFAGVIAATENFVCLSRFVQLKGLPLLAKWLQDVHKGKIGEGIPKDGDKIEEFIFILLRALEKLPVNLQALQMCNIGKSVNHLRNYKNSEIQKKARSLVDTWKKRVEAEMNIIDTKSNSSAAKINSNNPVNVTPPVKDGQPRSGVGSNPERSSNSSQSRNNSQSYSSGHAKTTGFSGKEDARSSTAGSISVNNKISSRPRRSVDCHRGSSLSESPRETGSSRNSFSYRNLDSEKLSQSGLTCENKITVRIPNRGCGPVEDPTVMQSRDSSLAILEKNDQSDTDSKENADVKTESWQSNDFKEILTGSNEGDGSPEAIPEGYEIDDDDVKLADISEDVSPFLGNEMKLEKLHVASGSFINALIESSVNYPQVNASISCDDDGGMNLLASVAAGEISKSNVPSPNASSGNSISDDANEVFKLEDSINYVNLVPQINDRTDEDKDIATSPVCAAGKILMGDENKQLDKTDNTKIEVTNLKKSNDNVVDVAPCLDIKREASVVVPSNVSLDADSEIKADVTEGNINDVREGFNKKIPSNCADKLEGVKVEGKEMTCDVADESKVIKSCAVKVAAEIHVNKKPKFDLNEGFCSDDGKLGDYPMTLEDTGFPVSASKVNPLPFPAAAKGSFVPPIDLLKIQKEIGWKGSAATSAFRPAKPKKQNRPVFDFDLNIADEIISEDIPSKKMEKISSVGPGLDLNRLDEAGGDTWQEVPFSPQKSSSYPISESRKGFDLNNGPVLDEAIAPLFHNEHINRDIHIFPSLGTSNSWFPQPIPIVGPTNGPIPFSPELYRGSSAVPFPSFQYPVFSYGNGFPVPSASFSNISNTQLLSGSHFPRPFNVSLPDGSNIDSIWGRQGLDLNAGPGNVERESRDELSPFLSRQLSVARSQALADEQGMMFQQVAGSGFKRKENTDNFMYKESSWR